MKQKDFNSNIIQRVLKTAKEVRLCSDYKFFKMGAVLFTNKKVLVAASNENKTNPLQKSYDRYRNFEVDMSKGCVHAEMNALIKLKRLYPNVRPEDVAIMVYRETHNQHCALAKPCPACEKALRDYGITSVYYTGNDSLCYEKYLLDK